ncbi:MAG TPA: glycosyltransferase [Fibrobacteraceae bacterium]|nr:glycosyltransferase [Fibrobacteraceae bacterium]
MNHPERNFRIQVRQEFDAYLQQEASRFADSEALRIDLHCHDHNSDVPDELWGRILRLPETWVETSEVMDKLRASGSQAMTITNHNNARSCWELLEKGEDILPGAEFTCRFEDLGFSAHVLAYGFTPAQEQRLNQLRTDAYHFLDYALEQDIPTVLPHPLYLYHDKPSLGFVAYEKLALLFERFEVMNGQRDVLQNLLVSEWLRSLTPETLDEWGRKYGIPPDRYCRDPYRKRATGGSDDHFALFVGGAGTRLHVPDLANQLKRKKISEIALNAIRHGDMAPYGTIAEDEKLSIAFLDYFCQVALNMNDPGLLRMFLHRGDLKDKLICLAVSNAMQELRRHKYTMRFLTVFHEALRGRKPGILTALTVSRDYRPLLDDVGSLAQSAKLGPEPHHEFMASIENMFLKINRLMSKRIGDRLGKEMANPRFRALSMDDLIRRFELPSHFRMLSDSSKSLQEGKPNDMTTFSVATLMDQLSFPALFFGIMGGARFMSARVLYHDRGTVQSFAKAIGGHSLPRRILWLTDTLYDKNGVASVLEAVLREVERRNLPIDFLICSDSVAPRDHLQVVPSIGNFALENFSEQRFRIPNLMDVHKLFLEGGYDRILCSTEAPMGVVALYLKQAFHVPAFFYMHTDWLDYVRRMTDMDTHSLDRVRRLLRATYRSFDGVFVLNSEHRDWLTSRAVGMPRRRVYQTAHWTEGHFMPPTQRRAYDPEKPILLFAGRISQEKGVFELPQILLEVRKICPGARLRIAGTGVAESSLRQSLPDAEFLGWLSPEQLVSAYQNADFLLLPSRFDTFGCVVTEAMACGLPVSAYDTKGPRDIIGHGKNGLLGKNAMELGKMLGPILREPDRLLQMREAAIARAAEYAKEPIMDRLMENVGLVDAAH